MSSLFGMIDNGMSDSMIYCDSFSKFCAITAGLEAISCLNDYLVFQPGRHQAGL